MTHELIHVESGAEPYRWVHDPMKMIQTLNDIEAELSVQGCNVARGDFGTVILKLTDGEVWYVPGDRGVYEQIYRYKDVPTVENEDDKGEAAHLPKEIVQHTRCLAYLAMRSLGMDEQDINKMVSYLEMYFWSATDPTLTPIDHLQTTLNRLNTIRPQHKETILAAMKKTAEEHAGVPADEVLQKVIRIRNAR